MVTSKYRASVEIVADQLKSTVSMKILLFKATWHRTHVAVKRVAIDAEGDGDKGSEVLTRGVSGATERGVAAVDKKNINDLRKESRILSSLKHPNILQFLGCHFQ